MQNCSAYDEYGLDVVSDAAWQAIAAMIVAAMTAIIAPSVLRRFQVEDKREDDLVKELAGYRSERSAELLGLRNECTELRVKNTTLSAQLDELRKLFDTMRVQMAQLSTDNDRLTKDV